MSDVDATLGIAELIKTNDPELWEHLMVFRSHDNVSNFIEKNKICILPPTTSNGEYTPVGHSLDKVLIDRHLTTDNLQI